MVKKAQRNKKPAGKPVKKQPVASPHIKPGLVAFIFLGVILLFIAWIRIRLLSFPLERDEGEYAYFGQLILQGFPPYGHAYNLKLPGTYYSYAFIMSIFGQTPSGIHFGLLLFNMGSVVFLFMIAKKLFNDFSAVVAAATFGLLCLSPAMLGQAAHATHFVTFFMLGGAWFLILAIEKQNLWYSLSAGIMMGLAFLMKQSGVFFGVFAGLVILIHVFTDRTQILRGIVRLLVYIAGVCIPVGLLFLVMYYSGVFAKFWFWTITYPGVYASRVPLSEAWNSFTMNFTPILNASFGLWIAAALGALSLIFYPGKSRSRIFTVIFLLFSILTVLPGFYFRSHYFVPLLPAVGLVTALLFDMINQRIKKHFSLVVFATGFVFLMIAGSTVATNKEFFFARDPSDLCRTIYAGNPFTESQPIARYLKENTNPKDKIFIFGSEPQIYFYAQRQSASGYIYMYDLAFNQKYVKEMQQEMFRDVEAAKPEFILFVSCPYSWLPEQGVVDTVFNWINAYIQKNNYVQTCVADIYVTEPTTYVWNAEALNYRPKAGTSVTVLRRGNRVTK